MCGRLTVTTNDKTRLHAAFPGVDMARLPGPRYNVAPSQPIAAILDARPHEISLVRWGLIPRWAKDPAIGNRLINARAETLAEKPSFRDALARRRCVIVADGFFEWAAVPGQRTKQPYFFRRLDGQPFGFAGLWETWRSPEGAEVVSGTIITTTPNELLAKFHDRMPAILTGEAWKRWIAPGPPHLDLLGPYPAAEMTCHPVSTLVNNPVADVPACIEPEARLF